MGCGHHGHFDKVAKKRVIPLLGDCGVLDTTFSFGPGRGIVEESR